MRIFKFYIIIVLSLFITSCQTFNSSCESLKNYHDDLIETSLFSEIPTLLGNCVGGIAGIPFLLISTPVAYLQGDSKKETSVQVASNSEEISENNKLSLKPSLENSNKKDTILWPIKITSHAGGILLGTPFYWPWAKEFFPREK